VSEKAAEGEAATAARRSSGALAEASEQSERTAVSEPNGRRPQARPAATRNEVERAKQEAWPASKASARP